VHLAAGKLTLVTGLALVAGLLPAVAGGAEGLGLAQVTCVAQADPEADEATYSAACTQGNALLGASAVAVSPDGRNVYVAAYDAGSLVAYARSSALGQLTEIGCISNNGTNGIDGTKRRCADGDALRGADDIAISPDGKNIYVAAGDSGGIAIFTRDTTTGKVVETGCVRGVSTCVGARGLGGAAAVVVSPDGRNVYLASYGADAVVMFARDAATGALKALGCISDDGTDRQCASGNALRGAGALAISKDGRWLYVGAVDSNSVLTFERDASSGLLTQRGCVLDHAPANGSCTPAHSLLSPWALALAPDGKSLFVASNASNAVVVFARNAATGKLAERGCLSDNSYGDPKDGCVHTVPLISPTDIALSADGRRLYVTTDAGLTLLERDTANGGLVRAGCALSRGYYVEPDDKRFEQCIVARAVAGAAGVAPSADGRNVYVAANWSNSVAVFAPAATVSVRRALSTRNVLAVSVSCPLVAAAACSGKLALARRPSGLSAARPRAFRLAAGQTRMVFLRLAATVRKSRGARLVLTATDRRGHVGPTVHYVSIGKPAPVRHPRGR
jgi:6-phosphogluconolactonase (cycloisomerase 2 family)